MELGKVLAPLADYREKMVFVSGLFHEQARKGNIHSSQTGNLLFRRADCLRRRNPFGNQLRPAAGAELRTLDEFRVSC